MKFPRSARIFRGQLDAAPFACVFFLLLLFVLLGSLLYTPGVKVELPRADDLPGIDTPSVSVAVDAGGRFYFANRLIEKNQLQAELRQAVSNAPGPLTLVVQADKAVAEANLVDLAVLARNAGIHDLMLATLPSLFTHSGSAGSPGAP